MSSGVKQAAGFVLTVVGYALTAVPGFQALGYTLIVAGAAISYDGARQAAREAERRARAGLNKASSAIRGNVRGSFEHHIMVFGRARVGGLVAMVGTTDEIGSEGQNRPDARFWVGLEHSIVHAGGCHGMRDIWIDDIRVPASLIDANGNVIDGQFKDLVQVKFHAGTGTQAADATTVGLGLDYADAYRRGICWSWANFLRPEDDEAFRAAFPFMSIPTLTIEADGIKCYDPRKDSTNGGSGSHRYTDALTWEWSNNPALCAATYTIMRVMDGGEGIPPTNIIWSSVATAANICDETISVPKHEADLFWNPDGEAPFWGAPDDLFWQSDAIYRFRCDGVVSTADKRKVNLQKILDSMLGVRVPVGSQYKFYASAYLTPTVAIDDIWLAGPVKITTQPPLESRYNAVRINYDDRAQDYKTVEAPPFTSAAYEAQDGGVRIWRDMTMPMVANGYNAQYLAMIHGAKSRKQTIVEMTCNLLALDIEVWENATLDFSVAGVDLSWTNFKGYTLRLATGPGSVQEQAISAYDVSTKIATAPLNWLATYLDVPGTSGNYASTPDSASVSITGDIDIRVKVALDDWTPAATQSLIGKWLETGNQRSFAFRVHTDGRPRLIWSTTGLSGGNIEMLATAAPVVSNGETLWLRVTLDVDDGAGNRVATFYTSTDGVTWTQLGAAVTTAGTTNIFDGTAVVHIGGPDATIGPMAGNVYYAELRNGIGGAVAASFSAADARLGATSVVSSQTGETWTLNGTAALAPVPDATTTYEVLLGDQVVDSGTAQAGSNGGLTLAANAGRRVFKCVHWQPTPRGIVLTFQEDAAWIYTPGTFQEQDRGTLPAIGSEVPGVPTGVTATPTADGIRLDWTIDMGFALAKTEIHRARYVDPNNFQLLDAVPLTQAFYIDNVLDGGTFLYKLRAVSRTAQKSEFSATVQVTGKVAADAAGVEVLNGHFEFGDVYWSDKDTGWSIAFDPANSMSGSYSARFDGAAVDGAMLNDKVNATSFGSTVEIIARLKRSGGAGSGRVMVRFYDSVGAAIGDYYGSNVSFLSYQISRGVITAPVNADTYRVGVHVTGAAGGNTWYADTVQSKFTPKEPYNLTVAGSGQQVGDQRNMPPVVGWNATPALQTSGPLTASDAGASATITVAAFTIQGGFGTVGYNAGSITGLAFSTTYYVYCDDPTYAGGAVSYFATTTPANVTANSGRVYVGFIATPADGGGGTSGGGPTCVHVECLLGPGRAAGEADAGDALHMMSDDQVFFLGQVERIGGIFNEPCVRIEMAGGAAVTVSESTPCTLLDGSSCLAKDLQPALLLATRYAGDVCWEPIKTVRAAGILPVVRLHAHGNSYAAGHSADALVYTHNPMKP